MTRHRPLISLDRITAVIFDTDGVVTDTARVHAAAWKAVFDAYLRTRATRLDLAFQPFDVRADYLRYVEGRPRLDGVRDFLAARNITLPETSPDDDPAFDSVSAIGARKDAMFMAHVRRDGIAAFPSTVALLRELRRRGARTAAVSASRHCAEVLDRAGVADMFDVRVDGVDAARLDFPGKPSPDLFLEAVQRLSVGPEQGAVVDDAPAGIKAGMLGGFGLVVGVDRGGAAATLGERGADVVVGDLSDLDVTGRIPAPHAAHAAQRR